MKTAAGVGVSHHRNPRLAAEQAYHQAVRRAGLAERPDFLLMFASVGYPQDVIVRRVWEVSGGVPLAGCSGEGVIAQGEADEGNFSLAILAIRSDEVRFQAVSAGNMKAAPFANGQAIGGSLRGQWDQPPIGLLLLADGINFNFDQFTRGLTDALGPDHPVLLYGVMAADNFALKKTYQYHDAKAISDGAVAVLMTGSLRAAHAANHGCAAIGMERRVTACKDNQIFEIDRQPVLDILKEYLRAEEVDNWGQAVVNLSWGFKAPASSEDPHEDLVIRFMPAKDEAAGSITLSTEVVEDTPIWMTRRDQDKIAGGVARIAGQIQRQLQGATPKLILHFDCAGRGKVVFREQQKLEILRSLQQTLGAEVPWIGIYGYGEIGPVGNLNQFHNYTLSLLALY